MPDNRVKKSLAVICYIACLSTFSVIDRAHAAECVDPQSESTPLHLSSIGSEFAVQAVFDGTYQVHCEYIEIEFRSVEIKVTEDSNFKNRRLLGDVRIALGTGNSKSWNTSTFVQIAGVNRVLGPGESMRFRIGSARVPLKGATDLSKRWFVAEIRSSTDLSGRGVFGSSFVHSDRDIFSSLKSQ